MSAGLQIDVLAKLQLNSAFTQSQLTRKHKATDHTKYSIPKLIIRSIYQHMQKGSSHSTNVFHTEQLGDAPTAGALRMSVSTHLQTSSCELLCPSSQPSNMNFPTLSRHCLAVPCSRGTLLSIPPQPLALLLTMCFPLGCNIQMTTVRNEHKILPRCTQDPWVELSPGQRHQQPFPQPSSSLHNS